MAIDVSRRSAAHLSVDRRRQVYKRYARAQVRSNNVMQTRKEPSGTREVQERASEAITSAQARTEVSSGSSGVASAARGVRLMRLCRPPFSIMKHGRKSSQASGIR